MIAAAAAMQPASAAEDLESQVRALRPADISAGERAVLENLDNRVREALAAIPRKPAMLSRDRAAVMRGQLERSLGFRQLPRPHDLQPRNAGAVTRPGYRISRIVFQTFPARMFPRICMYRSR